MTKARTLADLLDSSGDVKSSALDNATSSLSDLSVTATASELNTLDGITATTAELNLMDGVTATTAEINYLDGVTSNLQTQIDGISSEVVDDTTPSLGGDLSTNGNDINFGDNDKAQFGDSNDLIIHHNGGNSFIEDNGSGSLYIDASNFHIRTSAHEKHMSAFDNGAVELYYNNSKKFETTTDGVRAKGRVEVDQVAAPTLVLDSTAANDTAMAAYASFQRGGSEKGWIGYGSSGDNHFRIQQGLNGPLILATNNAERLSINGDGSWRKAPPGTVLQVVQDVESNAQSYTGTGESTILSATITPKSSSSKILILCTTHINSLHGYRYAYGKLYRGSSTVFNGNSSGNRAKVTVGNAGNSNGYDRYVLMSQSFSVLDSPATTSATTYYMKMGNSYYNTTVYNNRTSVDANAGYSQRGASSLILMEIAG